VAWKWNEARPDYPRLYYVRRQHRARYQRYVAGHGLLCQSCGGAGGETDVLLDDGTGPWEPCGWCEGTGKVTRWLRGLYLSYMRDEKRRRLNGRLVRSA